MASASEIGAVAAASGGGARSVVSVGLPSTPPRFWPIWAPPTRCRVLRAPRGSLSSRQPPDGGARRCDQVRRRALAASIARPATTNAPGGELLAVDQIAASTPFLAASEHSWRRVSPPEVPTLHRPCARCARAAPLTPGPRRASAPRTCWRCRRRCTHPAVGGTPTAAALDLIGAKSRTRAAGTRAVRWSTPRRRRPYRRILSPRGATATLYSGAASSGFDATAEWPDRVARALSGALGLARSDAVPARRRRELPLRTAAIQTCGPRPARQPGRRRRRRVWSPARGRPRWSPRGARGACARIRDRQARADSSRSAGPSAATRSPDLHVGHRGRALLPAVIEAALAASRGDVSATVRPSCTRWPSQTSIAAAVGGFVRRFTTWARPRLVAGPAPRCAAVGAAWQPLAYRRRPGPPQRSAAQSARAVRSGPDAERAARAEAARLFRPPAGGAGDLRFRSLIDLIASGIARARGLILPPRPGHPRRRPRLAFTLASRAAIPAAGRAARPAIRVRPDAWGDRPVLAWVGAPIARDLARVMSRTAASRGMAGPSSRRRARRFVLAEHGGPRRLDRRGGALGYVAHARPMGRAAVAAPARGVYPGLGRRRPRRPAMERALARPGPRAPRCRRDRRGARRGHSCSATAAVGYRLVVDGCRDLTVLIQRAPPDRGLISGAASAAAAAAHRAGAAPSLRADVVALAFVRDLPLAIVLSTTVAPHLRRPAVAPSACRRRVRAAVATPPR